jgi:hypothetical protein
MKFKNLPLLAMMGMALFISSAFVRASEPMNEDEIKIYKKYEGKWGGGIWPSKSSKLKGRSVDFEIGKIDSAKRKAEVIYILGEGRKGESASRNTEMADCVDGKLIFETSANRIELWIKGDDELFAERKGSAPSKTILKRTQ